MDQKWVDRVKQQRANKEQIRDEWRRLGSEERILEAKAKGVELEQRRVGLALKGEAELVEAGRVKVEGARVVPPRR